MSTHLRTRVGVVLPMILIFAVAGRPPFRSRAVAAVARLTRTTHVMAAPPSGTAANQDSPRKIGGPLYAEPARACSVPLPQFVSHVRTIPLPRFTAHVRTIPMPLIPTC